MNTKTTATRTLNGLAHDYKVSISSLAPASVVSQLCIGVEGLLQLRDQGKIGMDRIKGMLDGKTQDIVDLSQLFVGHVQREQVMKSFGKVWDEFYDAKHLDRLMHASVGPNPYAGLIAAYGMTATVSKSTEAAVIAAAALDKKLGIDPTIGAGVIAR